MLFSKPRPLVLFLIAIPLFAQKFEIEEATIAQVHDAMKAGTLTCKALVAQYLRRIDTYDRNGPSINAIVLINPEAEKQAEELDRRFKAGGFTGPLHCVPVIVKDNFETAGLRTTNGALALEKFIPKQDAFQVKRIKEAGAIVLAKSNLAEWAFSPYETVSSIQPGYTKNPYALDRVTAGSSGGTAASVAASFGLVGLGSDTGNSIRGPSSHQSLVGIRSTMGLTSRAGVVPLSNLADIAGPMARTVEDAVRVFQVIVGSDPDDTATAPADAHKNPNYAASLDKNGLKGATIGILRQAYERDTTDPEIVGIFNNAIEELKAAGATVIDAPVDLSAVQRARGGSGGGGAGGGGGSGGVGGQCQGFKYDLNHYLASKGDQVPVKNLTEIIASRGFHPSTQFRLEQAEKGPENGPESPACEADRKYREDFRQAVLKAMDKFKIDAFVYPTWSNVPRPIGDLNTPAGDNSQVFSPTTGFPAINVPMGFSRGNTLPAGITIFGKAWSEATLIKFAFAYEQATKHRHAPPTTPPLK